MVRLLTAPAAQHMPNHATFHLQKVRPVDMLMWEVQTVSAEQAPVLLVPATLSFITVVRLYFLQMALETIVPFINQVMQVIVHITIQRIRVVKAQQDFTTIQVVVLVEQKRPVVLVDIEPPAAPVTVVTTAAAPEEHFIQAQVVMEQMFTVDLDQEAAAAAPTAFMVEVVMLVRMAAAEAAASILPDMVCKDSF
jgi:hypothetical protein